MTRDEALSKIKKLLTTSGRTEAEIDTAQILAAAIADRHNIDLAEVDRVEQERQMVITHRAVGEWAKVPTEVEYASLICGRFFEVSPFTRTRLWVEEMVFVGTEWHLQIAEYVFHFLVKEFRWQWNKRRGRCKKRKPFIYGCYVALYQKLAIRFERKTESEGLEISWKAKREKYIAENFGEMTSSSVAPKDKKSVAANRGYRAGQDIEIRPGLNADPIKNKPALGFEARLLSNG